MTALNKATQAFIKEAAQTPELGPTFSSYQINVPQLNVGSGSREGEAIGRVGDRVFNTMQVYLGSLYVNDFNRFGRVYQVRVQADAPFRAHMPTTLDCSRRATRTGEMVPLSILVKVTPTYGPEMVVRYNGYTAADINGGPAAGYSSGQAQAAAREDAAGDVAARHQARMDRSHVSADSRLAMRRSGCSRSACCSCSSCSPQCMKA